MLKGLRRKLYLMSGTLRGLFFVLIILCITGIVLYTQQLVSELRKESRNIVEFYANTIQRVASDPMNSEALGWVFENITQRTNFPLILANKNGEPSSWKGLGIPEENRTLENLARVREIMKKMGKENKPVPIMYNDKIINYLYYGDSKHITQLSQLPYISLFSMGLLVLLAFLGFFSIKQSEQRFIWVGMAKETAHQLGTPISSLMGWLELLKSSEFDNTNKDMIITDIQTDVNRLEKIASRFSQIGSTPDLKKQNLRPVIDDILAYFSRRLPHNNKKITIRDNFSELPERPINRDLFEWALENLIKNAIDAVQKKDGLIEISCGTLPNDNQHIYIDIQDNGVGLNPKKRNDIFKPGYSTKKRGWGLGLNLAERIIEDYHKGKLFIKETRPNEGTTMRIIV